MKNTLYIRLMTIFMAIIGLNAALLVVYILVYSQFVGEFPQINNSSANLPITQINDSLNINATSPVNANPTPLSSIVSYENNADIVIPGNYAEVDYNPEKQKVFEELQVKKEQTEKIQNPTSVPEQDMQNNSTQGYYMQAALAPTQNIQEIANQNNNINSSGNADNFNTYNNPHLQQTTAPYILNISTQVFHFPQCNDVAKMAEKNCVESNATFNEIISQGYRPCGHCMKDYSNINYSNPSSNNSNPDINGNTSLQQAENTYIINTQSGYFHIPDKCKYVIKYSPEEVCTISNNSFEEIKAQGYRPCRHCFG